MREISRARGMTLSELVAEIDTTRQQQSNLSSAVRLFALDHYKEPRRLAPRGRAA